jgi:hypothetical protein
MLCFRQFAFTHNTLVLFARTFDAIFELPPIVRQLFGHFVGPARHIATDCGPDVYGLAILEFMRRHRTSISGRPTARSPHVRVACRRNASAPTRHSRDGKRQFGVANYTNVRDA